MRGKLTVPITSIFLIIFFAGYLILLAQPAPKKYELVIMKVDNDWKVVDATDYSKTKVKVKKKDTIVWTLKGTDASLQFPDKLFNAVDPEDSLHNGYTKFLKDGKKLKLKVRDDALSGTYEYAVFCIKDGVFARGDSPPKIVIE
jgi:hypothetical protein